MAFLTLRRIAPLDHDTYHQYASRSSVTPGLVWNVPGRHADFRSTI